MTEAQIKNYISLIENSVGKNAKIVQAPSGLVNTVFLVDQRYVFRFPRDEEVYAQQVFERDVCSYLARHSENLPIAILNPIDKTFDHCFVYEYIPGETMDEQKLRSLDPAQQQAFIRDLLSFIFWLGETLQPATYREIVVASTGQSIESWEAYIGRTVSRFNDSQHFALTEVCRDLISEMAIFYPEGVEAHTDRVIHDDLHMGNLLFVNNKLSGVIDFGNIMIGDLACELRHFYRLSPEIARQACDIYEVTYGQKASLDKVAWWAKLNDAATLCDKIMSGKVGSPSYLRALNNLSKWYPDKNWKF